MNDGGAEGPKQGAEAQSARVPRGSVGHPVWGEGSRGNFLIF